MGNSPRDGKPILLNENIFVVCGVLKCLAASAEEIKLGSLFINGKKTKVILLILEEMGHPRPPTLVHCDNKTATCSANDTAKSTCRSRSMEMRYFLVRDQVHRIFFDIIWQPGAEKNIGNFAGYFSKHHLGTHHKKARPWYIQTPNSMRLLPRGVSSRCSERVCWNPGT